MLCAIVRKNRVWEIAIVGNIGWTTSAPPSLNHDWILHRNSSGTLHGTFDSGTSPSTVSRKTSQYRRTSADSRLGSMEDHVLCGKWNLPKLLASSHRPFHCHKDVFGIKLVTPHHPEVHRAREGEVLWPWSRWCRGRRVVQALWLSSQLDMRVLLGLGRPRTTVP